MGSRSAKWLLVSFTMLGLAGVASATDSYTNNFSSLTDIYTWHSVGTAVYGDAYLSDGNTAVSMDVTSGTGYFFIDVGCGQPTGTPPVPPAISPGITGAPFDVTHGVLTFIGRYHYTGGGPGPTFPLGVWLRLYSGVPVTGGWEPRARWAYFMWIPTDNDWITAQWNVAMPGATNYYNGGTTFDPLSFYRVRADFVYWDETWNTNTLSADHVFIEKGAAPVANAGTDQTIEAPSCGPVFVDLDGHLSVAVFDPSTSRGGATITGWEWKEGDAVLSNEGPIAHDVSLGPGVHTINLTITCNDGLQAKDTVVVTINAAGLLPLPVDIPMTAQINNGGGDPTWDVITLGDGFFPPDPAFSADGTTGTLMGGGWYFGPYVAFDKACYQTPIDVTAPGLHLKFTARYYQDPTNANPYADAPIGVQFLDVNGRHGMVDCLTGTAEPWAYGPAEGSDVVKDIDTTISFYTGDPPDPWWTDPDFDGTKIRALRFMGTDWDGAGFDFVQIKNLWIGVVAGPCQGDFNCDGLIDFNDIDPFVAVLSGGTCCDGTGYNCDVNGNGSVGFDDIDPFVALLSSGATCP